MWLCGESTSGTASLIPVTWLKAAQIPSRGDVRDQRAHPRIEPRDGEALLAPHARPHHDQGPAVPVRAAREILGRPIVAEVHRQEIGCVAAVPPDEAVVLG